MKSHRVHSTIDAAAVAAVAADDDDQHTSLLLLLFVAHIAGARVLLLTEVAIDQKIENNSKSLNAKES